MSNSIGPVTAGDEMFCHQTTETFATVATSDLAWTEKVCAMAAARDGSLQLGFGLGKYNNRNVMDAYAGISRGVEQITVRSSRRLHPDLFTTVIDPIQYEVVEPLHKVRFALEANSQQPIAFEWFFESALPCQLEERTHQRTPDGRRVNAELVRYHQIGTANGWIEIDGDRTEMTNEQWVSTRDHSWGVRYDVGAPATDMETNDIMDDLAFSMIWCPMLCERPDGSRYGIFLHTHMIEGFGSVFRKTVTGAIEHEDGRVEPIMNIELDVDLHPITRRLRGGVVHCTMADGSARPLTITVPTETGFHLGAGLYFGWNGHHHGEFRGELHTESERIVDCTASEVFQSLHQIRDTFVIVDDPVGGGIGYGNCQPVFTGEQPERGLERASSFW